VEEEEEVMDKDLTDCIVVLGIPAMAFIGIFIGFVKLYSIVWDSMANKKKKRWGIWIPSLERWLEDEYMVPFVTNLKRDAKAVVKQECVHPKQYEVREYEDLSDA
jgi:hypothetical protein